MCQTIFFLGEASREEVRRSRRPRRFPLLHSLGRCVAGESRSYNRSRSSFYSALKMKRKQERRKPNQTADRMSLASGRSQ
jgi:hypothetical protein